MFQTTFFLVGGFNPSEKYWSKWMISPGWGGNKKNWNHNLVLVSISLYIKIPVVHLGLKTTTHKENHSVANHVRFHASTPLPYLVILPCQYLSQNSWFAEFLVICQPKNNVNGPPGVPLIVINGGTWGRFCWWALMGLHGVNFYPTLRGEMTPLTTGDRAHLVVRLFLSHRGSVENGFLQNEFPGKTWG